MKMLMIPNSIDRFLDLVAKTKSKRAIPVDVVVAAADHGVAKTGISRYHYGDTYKVLKIVASAHSPLSKLCRSMDIEPHLVNVGCLENNKHPKINSEFWLRGGTNNLIEEDALSFQSIETIFGNASKFAKRLESDNICLGEVGIGNTICSTLIISIVSNQLLNELMGLGSGIDQESFERKKEIGLAALLRFQAQYPDDLKDPVKLLASLGGIELAWNTGLILAAANEGKTIYLDGLNTSVSAYLAYLIDPSIKERLMATHLSREPSHKTILKLMDQEPFLHLDLALGQGFGALLGYSFLSHYNNLF